MFHGVEWFENQSEKPWILEYLFQKINVITNQGQRSHFFKDVSKTE